MRPGFACPHPRALRSGFAQGPCERYLLPVGINIAQVVRQWALRSPERTAVVLPEEGNRRVSYAELDLRAFRAARALSDLGLKPGARVALSVANGLPFLDAFFGALYAGCCVVPVPPMSAPPELAQRLSHARCKALITDSRTRALGEAARELAAGVPDAALESLLSIDAETLVSADHTDRSDRSLARALAEPADRSLAHALAEPGPVDLPAGAAALMLYTSGTTGKAKGAVITHASLATHTAAIVHHELKLVETDVVLAALPLTHSYGIRMTLLAPFYAGASCVLLERFQAHAVLTQLNLQHVTWFPGVPTMFHALVHAEETEAMLPLPHLRSCLSAGAPLAPEIRRRFEMRFETPLRQGFGLTEATFSTLGCPDDLRGPDSVGTPVFGVEVRIYDATGRRLPEDTDGEICIRGQNVMAGYFEDEEATQACFRDGFLRTGDVGRLDSEGRLYVVDRIKDLIVRGGFNVYPAEVEAVLLMHASIRQAVVASMPDAKHGEEIVAVLVLAPGASLDLAALDSHCRAQLSPVKIPRRWATVAAIPQGPSGKLLRREVRSQILDGRLTLLAR